MKLYTLSKGLKKARKNAHFTQAQLAEQLGVTTKTVMNWEQGVSNPTLETLIELTELYKCDLDYLTGRIEYKTHDTQFIHEQTGLSEEAIKKLQNITIEPDWEQLEQFLKAEAPDIDESKIETAVKRQKESYNNSLSRFYTEILSLLIEDASSEYLLSLITRRIKYHRYFRNPNSPTHSELTADDLWIEIDGQKILTHKRNMLDSLITSAFSNMIRDISDEYHRERMNR